MPNTTSGSPPDPATSEKSLLGRLARSAGSVVRERLERRIKRRINLELATRLDFTLAELSLTGGHARLTDIILANPQGYLSEHAVTCPQVILEFRPASLLTRRVHLTAITLSGARVMFEPGASRSEPSNLSALLGAMARTGQNPRRLVIIDTFQATDTRLQLMLPPLGPGGASLPFPDVTLRDIGLAERGVPPSQAARIILLKASDEATRMASQAAKALALRAMDKAKGAVDKLKGLFG